MMNPYTYIPQDDGANCNLREETSLWTHYSVNFSSAQSGPYLGNNQVLGEYFYPRNQRQAPLAMMRAVRRSGIVGFSERPVKDAERVTSLDTGADQGPPNLGLAFLRRSPALSRIDACVYYATDAAPAQLAKLQSRAFYKSLPLTSSSKSPRRCPHPRWGGQLMGCGPSATSRPLSEGRQSHGSPPWRWVRRQAVGP